MENDISRPDPITFVTLSLSTHYADIVMDLFGQLSGRDDDQGPDLTLMAFQQFLENRQDKGGRFTGAGLGQPHNITTFKNLGDSLILNGGRCFVATGLNTANYLLIKLKLFKLICLSLLCQCRASVTWRCIFSTFAWIR